MRPQKPFPEGTAERVRELLARAKRPDERARIQAVLMRAVSASTPAQIAAVTGLSVNSVRVLHSRFLRRGEAALVGGP
ncbi:MAG: helix-turn-helix domain-containing protein [Opitutaceae bacterium]|nr:helix-turn-helix domain-containing protein [Opitutaceae bacterium]